MIEKEALEQAAAALYEFNPIEDQESDLDNRPIGSVYRVGWESDGLTEDVRAQVRKEASEVIEAYLNALPPAAVAGDGAKSPLKLQVSAQWLRAKIETDPDLETEAAAPTPPPAPEGEAVAWQWRVREKNNPIGWSTWFGGRFPSPLGFPDLVWEERALYERPTPPEMDGLSRAIAADREAIVKLIREGKIAQRGDHTEAVALDEDELIAAIRALPVHASGFEVRKRG